MATFETDTVHGATIKAESRLGGLRENERVVISIADRSNGASCGLDKMRLGMLLSFLQQAFKTMK